ncbi:ion transporter [Lentilactobacillus raoultii]|uniref:Ion transporter n=1 Tax=Lentilactobacillus raoultii TaxID=1987503 RepID=A0ABW3PFW1_9LACO|nr:ion transporter [Lentilactobacillus raoultii]
MKNWLFKAYSIIVVFLALFSIMLTILDFSGIVNLEQIPWFYLDNGILLIFTVDYFLRLFISKNKWLFFKRNLFDLLAILPFYSVFSFFRFARVLRIMRMVRFFRFVRLIGFIGKVQKQSHQFFLTNGFIYLLWTSLAILLLSATLYSLSEKVSWGNSLWWAITTVTTVGYGDISPHTIIGKIAAVLLMFCGIGIIGSLTSTLTTFFTHQDNEDSLNKIFQQLKRLENENADLKNEIMELKKRVK